MKRIFMNLLRDNGSLLGKGANATATDFKNAIKDTDTVMVEVTDSENGDEPAYSGLSFEVGNLKSNGNGNYTGSVEGVEFSFQFSGGKLTFEATPAENFDELNPQPTFEADLKQNTTLKGKADITREELDEATKDGGDGLVYGDFTGQYAENYGMLNLKNTKKHETDANTFTAEDEDGNTYLLVATEGATKADVTVTAVATAQATEA